jgi:hypothetical protein
MRRRSPPGVALPHAYECGGPPRGADRHADREATWARRRDLQADVAVLADAERRRERWQPHPGSRDRRDLYRFDDRG